MKEIALRKLRLERLKFMEDKAEHELQERIQAAQDKFKEARKTIAFFSGLPLALSMLAPVGVELGQEENSVWFSEDTAQNAMKALRKLDLLPVDYNMRVYTPFMAKGSPAEKKEMKHSPAYIKASTREIRGKVVVEILKSRNDKTQTTTLLSWIRPPDDKILCIKVQLDTPPMEIMEETGPQYTSEWARRTWPKLTTCTSHYSESWWAYDPGEEKAPAAQKH